VEIDNWRWSGVPFRLQSGKAMRGARGVLVTFKPFAHLPPGLRGNNSQPRAATGGNRMALEMNVNGPDDPLKLDRVSLDTDLSLAAYRRTEVLAGVLDADRCSRSAGTQRSAGGLWIGTAGLARRKVPMDERCRVRRP
jgi:glucose-6-phosphate 1-dehydrogenase